MAFGVYIHIPYCLQICPYCDFTKYEFGKIMPPETYVETLSREIRSRAVDVPFKMIDTIYFGGGTPSLFEPSLILAILDELANAGFHRAKDAELTIEIDPATVDQSRLDGYLRIGINRFSVGAQTFNARLLKIAGRKHTSEQTVELLSLLKRNKVNYSFDLLFALPSQTREELRLDVATALNFEPSHLSAYCLTVPEGHPMAQGRAPDEEQVEMFEIIESELAKAGVLRYEISNYAKPGLESHHNLLYWTDQAYWGLGTGAHSYFPALGDWGTRFSNAPAINLYEREIKAMSDCKEGTGERAKPWQFTRDLGEKNLDPLQRHEAVTDFCHTAMRLTRGLERNALRLKFGPQVETKIAEIMGELVKRELVVETSVGWALTKAGRLLANVVFERLTVSADALS
jgi:oxygen-independent coproporphyrinogen-3 oxidase